MSNQSSSKGILGTKLGMTQVFDENNRVVPVTVVKAGPNVVTQIRTQAADGYDAVQLAFGAIDPRKVNKPVSGQFSKAGVTPRRHGVEIRTADAASYTVGQELGVDTFATHELPLSEAPKAYETFQKKDDGMVKVILKP